MFTRTHDPVQLLQRKLDVSDLSYNDRDALAALSIRVVPMGADQDIVLQGDQTSQSCLLVQGLACSWKITGKGKRQIVAFHLPGDLPDLLNLHSGVVDTAVTTLTPAKVGIILHKDLRQLFARPRLAEALWGSLVTDAAIAREWAVNLGRREGPCRTAHLLSELMERMHSIGAVEGDSFELPITQEVFGDALGMSTVHVNRCLKALRRQGLISWVGGRLFILDLEALADFGDFEDSYLHFGRRSPPAGVH